MKLVKSKLLKKKFAAFGTGDLHDEELERTPYIISLSSDPMLNLAVKIYLPPGNTLRIGKALESAQSSEPQPDLQVDGLGIEIGHCILQHQLTGEVLLTSSAPHSTYVNGCQLSCIASSDTSLQLTGNDRIVLGVCSHVFAFIDPKYHLRTLPTYEQALREVILGRGETENEKKERLAGMVLLFFAFTFQLF